MILLDDIAKVGLGDSKLVFSNENAKIPLILYLSEENQAFRPSRLQRFKRTPKALKFII
jgi:hypothetical protein